MVLLLTHLKKRGHQGCVFALQADGPLKRRLTLSGISVISGGFQKGDMRKAPWKLLGAQLKLFWTIKQLKPQIVHAFLPLTSFMGALAGRLACGCTVVISRRALGNHKKRFPPIIPFDLAANAMSHCITVNSLAVKEDLMRRERIGRKKTVLIYNGIDVDRFRVDPHTRQKWRSKMGVTATQKVIIVLANLIPYKGHKVFLHAAHLVNRCYPDARFWMVGEDRGIQFELKRLAGNLEIEDKVIFWGQRLDVPELLAASDIAVLASHEEGFSNVILEAMAAGLPVVATRVGGNPEAIVDGETGWLCPSRNAAFLAEKIIDLLRNPAKALAWGHNGRKRVKAQFTAERMVDDHLKLYRRLKGQNH